MNLAKALEAGGFEALLVFLAEIAKINQLFITTLELTYPAAVVSTSSHE
jgi:hypothetical protein